MRKRNMAKQENTKEEGLKSFFNNSHLCLADRDMPSTSSRRWLANKTRLRFERCFFHYRAK